MERALVIEIDGSQHDDRVAYDRGRDAWLAARCFTVLRFWNHDVLNRTESVLERIRQSVEAVPPLPAPLPLAGKGS